MLDYIDIAVTSIYNIFMFCVRCGGPIDPETNKCKYCDSWTGQPVPKPRQEQAQKGRNPFTPFVVVFAVVAAVTGIALVVVGVLSNRSYALIWIGAAFLMLALIVPVIAFSVYAAAGAVKGISKSFADGGLGSSIKSITENAGAAIGDFFNRFGPVGFTNKLTKEKFDSIQRGTALEHIEAMLGKGKQTYQSFSGGSEVKVVIWQENSMPVSVLNQNRKVVTVKFQDGGAVEKYQFGL